MADIYEMVSYVAFFLSFLCLVTVIVLGIKFNIVKILNDLSGRSAQKSIERMRNRNEKEYKPVRIYRDEKEKIEVSHLTEELLVSSTEAIGDTEVLGQTDVLEETTLLGDTAVLGDTEVLSDTKALGDMQDFAIVTDIMCVHTDEVVEK